ncbi:MAG: type VI secretion system baseplate subunit TssK [Planctomycetota bacterium]
MSTRVERSVLWREGMFLYPQHLQAFTREVRAGVRSAGALGLVGDYGLIDLEVDGDALQDGVFDVRSVKLVLRDGTLVEVPVNGTVPKREFTEFFTGPELDVHFGVPTAQAGVAQIGGPDEVGGARARYGVEREKVQDENARDSHREVEFRRLQGHLFFGDEERAGFDTVLVARLARTGSGKAKTQLSRTFVPPVLRCGASAVLEHDLNALADKARSQSRDLAARMPDISRLSSVDKGTDIQGLFKLQAVNQAVALLEHAAGQPHLHPYDAYQALTRSAGTLAIFGPGRVVPDLPVYDHDDLDHCFRTAIDAVDGLLAAEVAALRLDALRPRRRAPRLYRCSMPSEWNTANAIFHLAVEMSEEPDEVRDLVAAGVKLLPEQDIERVLRGVMPGIGLTHERVHRCRSQRNTLLLPRRDGGREPRRGGRQSRDAVINALGGPTSVLPVLRRVPRLTSSRRRRRHEPAASVAIRPIADTGVACDRRAGRTDPRVGRVPATEDPWPDRRRP